MPRSGASASRGEVVVATVDPHGSSSRRADDDSLRAFADRSRGVPGQRPYETLIARFLFGITASATTGTEKDFERR
jgi:hypothetical protein